MPMMKDSGIEWVGEIPSHWKAQKTKYNLINTKYIPGIHAKEYDRLSLTLRGVLPRDKEDADGLQPKDFDTYQLLKKDELVFKLIDLQNVSTSRVGLAHDTGLVSPAYIVLHANGDVFPAFAEKYFLMLWHREIFNALGDNGVRSSLNASDLLNVPICFPSMEEQEKIASFLDAKCTEIDALSADIQAEIDTLEEYKKSVITEAVTKGLNPDVEMKDSGIEWIGQIPKDWDIMPIKYLKTGEKNAFVDGPFGSNLKSEHFVDDGDVYVIESGFISTGKFIYKDFKTITQEHFETIKRSECKEGDIIIAKIGANYGMAGELPQLDKPSVVSGNSLKLSLNQNKMLNYLFVRQLEMAKKNGGFISIVNETAQPALSLGTLNNFRLIVAPINEQQLITDYLYKKCTEIDGIIKDKKKQLETLEEYKKSLIYEYVTGKKEVPAEW